jgi:hypothetical protein
MKKTDRFLVGLVAGIVVLVVVTLVVALRQPAPTYQPDDTPEGVAHNYLLALQQSDYARAYGYLSPTLPGYPADSDEFAQHTARHRWSFGFDEETAVTITGATINGDRATARATINRFYNDGPFSSGVSTTQFILVLREENGDWKITRSDRYWANCWNQPNGCQ